MTGSVFTGLGEFHWGGMFYGLACFILILNIAAHFLSLFQLFAPQLAVLKRAVSKPFSPCLQVSGSFTGEECSTDWHVLFLS